MALALRETPPSGWDARVGSAYLFTGFAAASAELGLRAFYAEDADDRALVLVRAVPLLARWTGRAKVYTARRHPGFLVRLLDTLADRGIVDVRVGHQQHGWTGRWPLRPCIRPQRLWTTIIDDASAAPEAFLGARPVVRANLAKAARGGVEVREARTTAEVDAARALMADTDARIRKQGVTHLYPATFVHAAWRHMRPRGQAVILLAQAGAQPLAAQLYFIEDARFVYYQGGSTRDRRYTRLQGPTAATWHAVQLAKSRGVRVVDFGGVNIDDPAQAGITAFKRQWGRFEAADVANVVLSPTAARLHELLLLPLWKHVHGLYAAAFGRRPVARPD